MIKLAQTKYYPQVTFYFHTMKECKKFISTFENYGCNLPWDDPEEVPDNTQIDAFDRAEMRRKPKKRAKDDLDWAYGICKSNNIGFTPEQQEKINQLMQMFCI